MASRCFRVISPKAIFGRRLLYVHAQRVYALRVQKCTRAYALVYATTPIRRWTNGF
jgi:hypothetical protein